MLSMGLPKNYWTNRHILITGAGGFVGSHLAKKLGELGAEVVSMIRREDGVDVIDRDALEDFFESIKIINIGRTLNNNIIYFI